MLMGASRPDATASSARAGGSAAISPALGDSPALGGALAGSDVGSAVTDRAGEDVRSGESDARGVAHAARATLMRLTTTRRRGSGIGLIVSRSGRVAPQP